MTGNAFRKAAVAAGLLGLVLGLAGCAGTKVPPAMAARAPMTQKAVPVVAPVPAIVPNPAPKPEGDVKFYAFLQDFRAEALKGGIAPATYDRAVAGLSINARVQALNENQPEFVRPVWDYLAGAVSEYRVQRGRELLAANAAMFDRLQAAYPVPRTVLAAIWGLESGYGQNEGGFNLFQALATLAYDGPRQDYGRRQFLAALKIADQDHLDPQTMTGSWAGAIGHTQFVPTTYLDHAVDGDGDGKRDLWNSPADALASTASYLQASGWRASERWGEEVLLPSDFPYENAELDIRKLPAEWSQLGVRRATGEPLGQDTQTMALFLPAGARGPAFLVGDNFNAILKYNQATSYALAVGVLSDRLAGEDGIIGTWPRDEVPLTRDQRIALQAGLETLGFETGGADGVLGRQTRAALRAYQKARALPVDGFATADLLTRILNEQQPGAH